MDVPVTRGLPESPTEDDGGSELGAADPLGTTTADPEATLETGSPPDGMADETAAAEDPAGALLLVAAADEEAGPETVIHCTEQELAEALP